MHTISDAGTVHVDGGQLKQVDFLEDFDPGQVEGGGGAMGDAEQQHMLDNRHSSNGYGEEDTPSPYARQPY